MIEFVGLRAKMYALRVEEKKEEGKGRQEQRYSEVYSVRGLQAVLE